MVLLLPAMAFISITYSGWWSLSAVVFSYFIIPALEFFFPLDQRNFNEAEEQKMKEEGGYDVLLLVMFPVTGGLLWYFLEVMSVGGFTWVEWVGKTTAMGITCGALGINVAHELGHRKGAIEQFFAKALLLTSLYMHFIIEHNRGHHKYVSTDEDPASARLNESLYLFWFRSIFMSYRSAWRLEAHRLKSVGARWYRNEMMWFQVIQVVLVAVIGLVFGYVSMGCFLGAALVGILQLETVNYIEHYGLRRKQKDSGQYERVQPWHSWNSNHVVGRLFLFELSRHSDHHYMASRKYQILRHHEEGPQMPTGYPGMMLLSLVPPLWFKVMHAKMKEYSRLERA